MKISVILLAGGIGTRMNAAQPKQYLCLNQKPVARHSFDLFLAMPEISQMVVVCEPQYQPIFASSYPNLHFASPGARRQDSLYNGLQAAEEADLICIHDAARPLISLPLVRRVLDAACTHGAATVGMPVKFTVKEVDPHCFVSRTPNRDRLWEIQTPQVIRRDLLEKGFAIAQEHNLTVTDDVALVELFHHPVKLIEGSHSNLKITVPEDLAIAERLLECTSIK